VPPSSGEPDIQAVEVLTDRQAVQHRESLDSLGIVECKPQGVVAAAIVPHYAKPIMT
jgi:hypothetical protein